MTIRDLAADDNTNLLNLDGEAITLITVKGDSYEFKGQYIRRGTDIDPGTGLVVQGNVSAWTVSLIDFSNYNLSAEEFENSDGWKISSKDVLGETVTCYVDKVLLDRTIGQVTIIGRV